jgi:multidrug resistance efflux pump
LDDCQLEAPDPIEIRAHVTGLLQRQAFADGARVSKGDLLYVIDPRPFELQRAHAEAGVAQAEANLAKAQQNLEDQQALLRIAELNLGLTAVRASRDGFLSSSRVKPGALITAQRTLMNTLYRSDPTA